MTFMEQFDLANNPAFIRRVTAAIIKAAIDAGNESFDGTHYQIMRRALSADVLQEPTTWGARFAYAVAQNPAVAATSSDDDIESTVSKVWDAMAGAFQ